MDDYRPSGVPDDAVAADMVGNGLSRVVSYEYVMILYGRLRKVGRRNRKAQPPNTQWLGKIALREEVRGRRNYVWQTLCGFASNDPGKSANKYKRKKAADPLGSSGFYFQRQTPQRGI